jgi:hypothetical protein
MKGYVTLNGVSGRYELKTDAGVILCRSKHQDYFEYHKAKGDNSACVSVSEFIYDKAPIGPKLDAVIDSGLDTEPFSINERFQILEAFVGMVATRVSPSAVITGPGGLGKTHTVFQTLAKHNLLPAPDFVSLSISGMEHMDPELLTIDQAIEVERFNEAEHLRKSSFVMVKGYSTAKGLYRTLFENKKGLIVFDDCDAVIKDKTGADILKSALDSYDERIVTWNSELQGSDLPKKFNFEGGIIFISNMRMKDVPQSLISRSLPADVSMTRAELIERMRLIIQNPDFMPTFDFDIKEEALDYIATLVDHSKIEEINLRSLIHGVKTRHAEPAIWKRLTLYALINAAKKEA